MLFYGSLWPVHMVDSSLTAPSGSGSAAMILGVVDKGEENKDEHCYLSKRTSGDH